MAERGEQQREHLGIILLPQHKTVLRELSRASGEAMAVVVRRLIREEGVRRGLWPVHAGQAAADREGAT